MNNTHNRRIVSLLTLIALSLNPMISNADENQKLKLKSEPVAWLLAIDPIPADALFYSGHPWEATGCLALGIAGVPAVLFGFEILSHSSSDDLKKNPYSTGAEVFSSAAGYGLIVVGAGMYLGSLIWDGVAGVRAVRKHNDVLRSIRPSVAFMPDGSSYAGVAFTF